MEMIKQLMMVLILIVSVGVNAQDIDKTPIVLELFTSQGCSSCPPADKLLDEIKKQYKNQNVFVLSYHVDYWNRLGWKDPFSSPLFSDYQREYALQFNSRSIYTPQLVINGSEHFTGSNRIKADQALKKYSSLKANTEIVLSDVKKETASITLDYKVNGGVFDNITVALVVSERITDISRGENRNRTLKNTNIVAGRIIKNADSGNISITIPEWISEKDELAVIAYTQDKSLKTTGATRIEIL